MLGNGGIFCCYSYVSPLMIHTSGFTEDEPYADYHAGRFRHVRGQYPRRPSLPTVLRPRRSCVLRSAAATLTLLGIFFGAHVPYLSAHADDALYGGCLFCVSSPQQLLILENSRGGEMLGAALVQVAFNLGNALGAYCGGLPIAHGLGYEYTALPGAAFHPVGAAGGRGLYP